MTVLLDTSALLVHALKERGYERVQELFAGEANEVLLAAVSITELARRLLEMGCEVDEARSVSLEYASLADGMVPVDAVAAVRAFEISALSPKRIPLVASLIAACASASAATLVHRDAHFGVVPAELVRTMEL